MKYELSIIIPAYNCAETIGDCLASIYRQRNADKYQTIVIDDGSRDHTADIVRELQFDHHNLELIQQPNAGVSVARNRGIDISNGEYVTFVDADDMVGLNAAAMNDMLSLYAKTSDIGNMYSRQGVFKCPACSPVFEDLYFYRMLSAAHETDADLVLGGKMTINNKRGYVRMHGYDYPLSGGTPAHKDIFLKQAEARENANFALYSQRLLKPNDGNALRFVPGMQLDEDMLFCMQAVIRANTVVTVPGALYLYNRHDNSLSNISDVDSRNNKYSIASVQRFSMLLTELGKIPEYDEIYTHWLQYFAELGETARNAHISCVDAYPTTCRGCPHEVCANCWYKDVVTTKLQNNLAQFIPKSAER